MFRRAFLLACVGVVSLAACDRKGGPAPTGGPRLAVMSPALAATLSDLGAGSAIVGRHAWDLSLDASIPVVSDDLGNVDYERLVATNPTLVIGQFGAGGIPSRLVEMASSRGWTLRDYNPLSLGDVVATARSLAEDAEAAGCVGVRAKLVEIEESLAASLRPRAGASKAGRILLLADVSPPAALGPGSVHHDILVSLGATPAILTGAAYITLDAEDLKRIAPDGVMLIVPRKHGVALASIPEVPGLKGVRMVVIDDPLTHLPATTIRATAEAMGAAIERWSR